MKTQRIILSIAAVMFAVAGALATNSFGSTTLIDPDVAIVNSDEECDIVGKCELGGEDPCRTPQNQDVSLITTTGTCSAAIDGRFHNP